MVKYREIIRLGAEKYSMREIASRVGHSHHTIKDVLERASKNSLKWPLNEDVTDKELTEILYPNRKKSEYYAEPDYNYVHTELAKPGVTLTLLWTEYCEKCRHEGQTPYMSTQFGDKYRKWARITKATMRITHKPGDACRSIGRATQFRCMITPWARHLPCIYSLPCCRAVAMHTQKPVST